jgi:hypothetical protein
MRNAWRGGKNSITIITSITNSEAIGGRIPTSCRPGVRVACRVSSHVGATIASPATTSAVRAMAMTLSGRRINATSKPPNTANMVGGTIISSVRWTGLNQ